MGCLIKQREHGRSVDSNITIYSIKYKEEDSVFTLTYFLFQECTDIALVETEINH